MGRVAEILSDPDRYFAAASARAWIAATVEIDADLAQRAEQRLNPDAPRRGWVGCS
jgi:hypothetical protein